ncbi:hypothetical protein, variant [Sphaeroforma arctica JP610]|uniref:Uncharacterized protein n=1 Tax=Sphaeroforma arctica JP610 TaxID=667725 RepID=A0A0L0FLL3_9EUKA|nr:hypothetical protein, variant [Sphaeroforma arctica JP610]KNC77640.1 hypothetical protein, variant [Sphaeroforma arctica JP610]|eukprot:XP_014151542.1 hypothetical protein, variant [Sphaeroforma arctica JP610]
MTEVNGNSVKGSTAEGKELNTGVAPLDVDSLAFSTPGIASLLGRWQFYARNSPTDGFRLVSPTYGFTACKGGRGKYDPDRKGPATGRANPRDAISEEPEDEDEQAEITGGDIIPDEDEEETVGLSTKYNFVGVYGYFHALNTAAQPTEPSMNWIQGHFDIAEPRDRTDDNEHQVHFFLRRNSIIFGHAGSDVPAAPLEDGSNISDSLVRRLSVTRVSKIMTESEDKNRPNPSDTLKDIQVDDLIVTVEDGSYEGISLLARCIHEPPGYVESTGSYCTVC